MITKWQFISDVILQLTQGAPSDDLELEEGQVADWGTYTLNNLVKQEIVAEMAAGRPIPPIYISREEGLELSEESVADISDSKQRIWVDLTDEVLDLPGDRGVVRVEDYDGNLVMKTSIEQLSMVRDLRFSRPSINNVLYYRIGKRVFVEGFNTGDLDFNPIIVYYVPKQDIASLSDTDEIKISDTLVPVLIDMCVQRGKLQLYGSVPDEGNDGVDRKAAQYHSVIANPAKKEQQQQPEEQ